MMTALCNRAGHYIFDVWFLLLLSSFFFSSPNVSRRRLDVYHSYTHTWCGLSANLGCMSETWCTRLAESTGRKKSPKIAKKSPSGQHRTTLWGYIFGRKACIDNRKETCPLAAEIGLPVWGTPANLNGFLVLAALLHGIPVLGVSQTLRR